MAKPSAPKSTTSKPSAPTHEAPKSTVGVAIQLRVPQDLADAIDREAARLQKERPGSTVHRSDVLRELAYRALMKGRK